jgi:hypothetical protein
MGEGTGSGKMDWEKKPVFPPFSHKKVGKCMGKFPNFHELFSEAPAGPPLAGVT